MPHKGDITDWVKALPKFSTKELVAQLDRAIALAAEKSEAEKAEAEEQELLASLPNWSQSDVALWLANKYKGKLAWNTELQEWYCYSAVTLGIWSVKPVEFVGQLIKNEIEGLAIAISASSKNRKKPTYTVSMLNGAIALLKMDLAVRRWNSSEGLLPLLNGVLNLETRQLLPHSHS